MLVISAQPLAAQTSARGRGILIDIATRELHQAVTQNVKILSTDIATSATWMILASSMTCRVCAARSSNNGPYGWKPRPSVREQKSRNARRKSRNTRRKSRNTRRKSRNTRRKSRNTRRKSRNARQKSRCVRPRSKRARKESSAGRRKYALEKAKLVVSRRGRDGLWRTLSD